jgi:16S rRNA processing protein RimM
MGRDVLLAVVTGASGLAGAVKARVFTADRQGLARYGTLRTGDGRALEVTSLKPGRGDEVTLTFAGIADRGAAEALRGTQLFVSRDVLPAPEAGEFYHTDLMGLSAYDEENRQIGRVSAIRNFGAGDVIELTRTDGDTIYLAFTRHTVPVIDIAGGRITVAVPQEDDGQDDERGRGPDAA